MSGLSAALVIPILIVVLVVPVVVVFVVVPAMRRRDEPVKAATRAYPTLRYHVPEGQDPAAVMAALETEGYAATLSPGPATHEVLIPCESGVDRERAHVRAVIAHASLNMEGDPGDQPVVFADEPGGTSGSGA